VTEVNSNLVVRIAKDFSYIGRLTFIRITL